MSKAGSCCIIYINGIVSRSTFTLALLHARILTSVRHTAALAQLTHVLALIPRFSGRYVAGDDPLNLSDYSPVSTYLSFLCLPLPLSLRNAPQLQPNWVKARKLKLLPTHTELIECKLWEIPVPDLDTLIGSPSCVEFVSPTDTPKRTAQECIPPECFQPHIKHIC